MQQCYKQSVINAPATCRGLFPFKFDWVMPCFREEAKNSCGHFPELKSNKLKRPKSDHF